MSASSGWCARADILDLDRYVRAAIPPHRHRGERLVVDAGGADRVPVALSTSSDSAGTPGAAAPPRGYAKRYSHDSGLSDGSYVKRRHRPHRRISESTSKPRSSRTAGSNSSVREFRAACEKALREQQEQIARVAQICERLVQPQMTALNPPQNAPNAPTNIGTNIPTMDQNLVTNMSPNLRQIIPQNLNANLSSNQYRVADQNSNNIGHSLNRNEINKLNINAYPATQNFGQHVCEKIEKCTQKRDRVAETDSSDATSSSGSFGNKGKGKDKHKSDSCKTYKIIMRKLDELSKLFAARRAPAPRAPASDLVSVSDKLVSTGPDLRGRTSPAIQVMHARVAKKRGCSEGGRGAALAHCTDISHGDNKHQHRVNESLEQWSASSGAETANFDLNDPLHLYEQAKRLQALHATTNRTNATTDDGRTRRVTDELGDRFADQLSDECSDKLGDKSLCALIRVYWRELRRCLTQQFFGGYS